MSMGPDWDPEVKKVLGETRVHLPEERKRKMTVQVAVKNVVLLVVLKSLPLRSLV